MLSPHQLANIIEQTLFCYTSYHFWRVRFGPEVRPIVMLRKLKIIETGHTIKLAVPGALLLYIL